MNQNISRPENQPTITLPSEDLVLLIADAGANQMTPDQYATRIIQKNLAQISAVVQSSIETPAEEQINGVLSVMVPAPVDAVAILNKFDTDNDRPPFTTMYRGISDLATMLQTASVNRHLENWGLK